MFFLVMLQHISQNVTKLGLQQAKNDIDQTYFGEVAV